MELVLGIDIGGTNVKFGIVNMEGHLLYKDTFETKIFESAEALAQKLYKHLEEKKFIPHIKGIGIGAPNGNFYKGTIENAPNLSWKGIVPLREIFATKFKINVVISNDANAAAIGEKIFGNGKLHQNFVTITLGTGLGSGIIIDHQLLIGNNGFAGEFGHIRLIPNGRPCNCGRNGCLETYASSTGVMTTFYEIKSEYKTSNLFELSEVSAQHIFDYAKNGDPLAQKVVQITAAHLGSALADFVCFSDPEAFILFGGIANSGEYFAHLVKQEMEKNILPIFKDKVQIKLSGIQESTAAIIGASALYLSNY